MSYTVLWEITVDKTGLEDPFSPLEAAASAWESRDRPESTANVFTVIDDNDPSRQFVVDLGDEAEHRVKPLKTIKEPEAADLAKQLAMMIQWAELTVKPQLGEAALPKGFDKAKNLLVNYLKKIK